MSTEDEELEAAGATPPELLSDEVARKWDPERLMQMFAKRAGKGEALDLSIRQRYEARFGIDLSHVRIVTGEFAEEFNKARGANAVTIGTTGMILMGGHADKSPISTAGEALLAHELTHVAQAYRGLHYDAIETPLATDEHEAEAEHVEAQVNAQAAGGGDKDHQKSKNDEELTEKVMHRVFDMLAEAGRADWLRNGGPLRRP